MLIRVKGVKKVVSRGHVYYYHRRTGTPLKAPYGTPEMAAEVQRLNGLVRNETPALAGTFGLLVDRYRASPEFTGLAERTRADYQRVLDGLQPMRDVPVASVDAAAIISIRDRAFARHRRRFANYTLAVLRLLFKWGLPRNLSVGDPTSAVPMVRRPKGMARANRPWTKAEREIVLARATGGIRVAVALGRFTGMREGDALRFNRHGYDGAGITFQAAKNGELVALRPVPSPLKAILDGVPAAQIPLVLNSRGAQFTASGFRASFFKLLRQLRVEELVGAGLTFHGLRHSIGDELADAGFDTKTIAAVLGDRTEAMGAHYSKGADKRRRTTAAMVRLERGRNAKRKTLADQSGKQAAEPLPEKTANPLK